MIDNSQVIQLGCQNTGNPILDSLVNLLIARTLSPSGPWNEGDFQRTHELLLLVGNKEPGALHRQQVPSNPSPQADQPLQEA